MLVVRCLSVVIIMLKKKRIVIDTNVFMAISELGLDLFAAIPMACSFPYEVFVLSGTISELEKIRDTQRGAFRNGARLALQILAKLDVEVLDSKEDDVDSELVLLSQQGDLILTQDRILKKRLVKPYLTIRQRKMISIVD